ncbi:hypothetical protein CQ018_08590 [Arthrobacter sp. MYb227]|uniref:hypothetical protein n=1 Tax=Arthrobacter sp. MYb227 TaxID=1848601 RepID=UPI000CFC14DD|nr:hypothetical protein [Arthrobacter sp. MYb227]PQZ93704.1 hypothetical protein CQ018_08590 [Arthrobacter sp. MYb227]
MTNIGTSQNSYPNDPIAERSECFGGNKILFPFVDEDAATEDQDLRLENGQNIRQIIWALKY